MDGAQIKARLRYALDSGQMGGLLDTFDSVQATLKYIESLEEHLDTPIGRRLEALQQRLEALQQRMDELAQRLAGQER